LSKVFGEGVYLEYYCKSTACGNCFRTTGMGWDFGGTTRRCQAFQMNLSL